MWSPVEFLLSYSSDAEKAQCRAPDVAHLGSSVLRYQAVPTRDYMGRSLTQIAEDPREAVTFVPDLTLQGNVKVQAVIDRMILTVITRRVTSYNGVKAIFDRAGLMTFVHDLRQRGSDKIYRGGIHPPPGAPAGTGQTFGIVVQDPEPYALAQALTALEDEIGLVAAPQIFVIEVALDFYPNQKHSLESRMRIREQLVGLLQRHHLLEAPAFFDGRSDPRQVYPDATGGRNEIIDFLFSSPGGAARLHPDTALKNHRVRDRLEHGRMQNMLFLNSTFYRGSQDDRLLVRIQNKVSNKRNPGAGTVERLPEKDQRARVEVEVGGYDQLEPLGLGSVQDLGTFKFRKIGTEFMQFWLPTSPENLDGQIMVRKQLEWRGVYGIELLQRLERWNEDAERRSVRKQVGVRRPRNRRGKGTTQRRVSWAECQRKIGNALDALEERWRGFSKRIPWR